MFCVNDPKLFQKQVDLVEMLPSLAVCLRVSDGGVVIVTVTHGVWDEQADRGCCVEIGAVYWREEGCRSVVLWLGSPATVYGEGCISEGKRGFCGGSVREMELFRVGWISPTIWD